MQLIKQRRLLGSSLRVIVVGVKTGIVIEKHGLIKIVIRVLTHLHEDSPSHLLLNVGFNELLLDADGRLAVLVLLLREQDGVSDAAVLFLQGLEAVNIVLIFTFLVF